MSFRWFLFSMVVLVVFSFFVFLAVLFWVDPTVSGVFGRLLFYGSVFFLVSGICAGMLGWIRMKKNTPGGVSVSFREGMFLGGLAVTILLFQSFRMLVWWVALSAGVFFLFLEGVFIVRSRRR